MATGRQRLPYTDNDNSDNNSTDYSHLENNNENNGNIDDNDNNNDDNSNVNNSDGNDIYDNLRENIQNDNNNKKQQNWQQERDDDKGNRRNDEQNLQNTIYLRDTNIGIIFTPNKGRRMKTSDVKILNAKSTHPTLINVYSKRKTREI
ncbi:myb-like protein D [Penaeus monodon]|uniref:myb-like protein D n=1 Tax=Penaeus monodon TaxID=6687 RepID=UPI0018A773F8|nr:myb-like protein D [Penaeus monodon]